MDDLHEVAERTSSALHNLQVQANESPELTASRARTVALRLRSARRRAIAGTGIAAVAAGVVIAAGVSFLGRSAAPPHTNTPVVRPADQPRCPALVPSQTGAGGILQADHPAPALATQCVYDPRSGRLNDGSGVFRPADIADFLRYVRSLPVAGASQCKTTAAVVAAVSVQILLVDHTSTSLVFRSTTDCVAISAGAATKTVRVASLTGQWRNVIDPALSFENPPSSGQPSGSADSTGDATSGPPTSTASSTN